MRGEIYCERDQHQVVRQVEPSRNEMLFVKQEAAGPVHILFGTPEIVHWNYDPRHHCLDFPSTRVITETPYRPQQEGRRHHVKQAQEANRQREVRIEHVGRRASEMAASQEFADEIDGVERLE